jgi:hypothetical protein
VRLAAAWSAWQLEDNALRTQLVQSLYHSKTIVRDRAAEALGYIEDPEVVPYLIEALYLVGQKTVEVQTEHPVTRGLGGVSVQGNFGGYWVQMGEVELQTRNVYIYSKKVLSALKRITKKDYDFSKKDWFDWWEKEGKKKLLEKKPEKPSDKPAEKPAEKPAK